MSVPDPTQNPLARLLDNAKQLNKASDAVNLELKTLEDTLNRANIGLSFWFETRPLQQSDTTGNLNTSHYTSDVLGYARVDGTWCLAIKRLQQVSGLFEGDPSCPFTNEFVVTEPEPLLKASRELRLRALKLMPEFLTALNEYVESNVGAIKAATGQVFGGRNESES